MNARPGKIPKHDKKHDSYDPRRFTGSGGG